jgi:hypothetical protein
MKEVVFTEYIKSSFSHISIKEAEFSSSFKGISLFLYFFISSFRSQILFELAFKRG